MEIEIYIKILKLTLLTTWYSELERFNLTKNKDGNALLITGYFCWAMIFIILILNLILYLKKRKNLFKPRRIQKREINNLLFEKEENDKQKISFDIWWFFILLFISLGLFIGNYGRYAYLLSSICTYFCLEDYIKKFYTYLDKKIRRFILIRKNLN